MQAGDFVQISWLLPGSKVRLHGRVFRFEAYDLRKNTSTLVYEPTGERLEVPSGTYVELVEPVKPS